MIQRTHFLFACLLFFTTSSTHAATVTQAKGLQVLIDLESSTVTEGDEFFLINPETQKKMALIRIKKAKGAKALGEVIKGKAATGFTLQAKSGVSGSPADSTKETAAAEAPLRTLRDSYGLLGSYIMSSMSADVSYNNGVTVVRSSTSMSGSGFGVGGFYDYAFNPSFAARGLAAIEQFSTKGSASVAACSGSTNCTADINYLSLYGLGKWYALQGTTRIWLGGGFGYLLALSKKSSALNESQIATNSVITAALGFDYQSSRKNYIPISLEYNMFPASDTVKASQILLKAGWAWNL